MNFMSVKSWKRGCMTDFVTKAFFSVLMLNIKQKTISLQSLLYKVLNVYPFILIAGYYISQFHDVLTIKGF